MAKKIETATTLDGRILKFIKKIEGLDFYCRTDSESDEVYIIICKNQVAIAEIKVTAECNQNYGFIKDFDISEIKEIN